MKLVDRHLSREFLRLFGVAVAAFIVLFLVVTFFEKLRFLLKYRASVADALLYFAARVPWIVAQVLPMASLLGTLLSASQFARQGEITAFRCGGVSLARLALPYLACGALVSVGTLFVQELVVPRASAYSREVEQVRIKRKARTDLIRARDVWLRVTAGVLHADLVRPDAGQLQGVTLIEARGARVTRRIDAREARWERGAWRLLDVEVRTFEPGGFSAVERLAEATYPLGYRPEDFAVSKLDPLELPWPTLKRLVARYDEQGLDTRELEAGLWAKTSLPFASAIMPLLAFPLAVRAGRRGGSSAAIALGVGLGFCYTLVLVVGVSLGKAGVLPPALGAWIGNLGFGAFGAFLLRRAEQAV